MNSLKYPNFWAYFRKAFIKYSFVEDLGDHTQINLCSFIDFSEHPSVKNSYSEILIVFHKTPCNLTKFLFMTQQNIPKNFIKDPLSEAVMSHIRAVKTDELNRKAAEELKKQKLVQPTEWSKFVKTGHSKERLPDNNDWWYSRSAAILQTIAKRGPVGTQKLRTKFGSKKRRGHKPSHFYKASGAIIRKILQQLETAKLIKQIEKGVHKGRIVTPKGTSFLDKIAVQMAKKEK